MDGRTDELQDLLELLVATKNEECWFLVLKTEEL